MKTPRSLLPAIAALAVFAALLTAVNVDAAAPLKVTNCSKAGSRLPQISLSCADDNIVLARTLWSSFGGATAIGKGTLVVNTCEPNCAEGHNVGYPAKVKLTGSITCKPGLRVYRKLALTFSGTAPGPGVPRTYTLACPR